MILNKFSKIVIFYNLATILVASDQSDDERITSVIGVVRKNDLLGYVSSLERALSYWGNHTNHETSSLYFGVFLMKVNLKPIVEKRIKFLPPELLDRMEDLVSLNKRVLRAYDQLIMHGKILGSSKKVLTLIDNEHVWANRLATFRAGAWEHLPPPKIRSELMLYNWTIYYDAVCDPFARDEAQHVLSKCLDKLSELPFSTAKKACHDVTSCKMFIEDIKDYGYGITQKLLTLQIAYYARGCYMFSQQVDTELRLEYCQSIHEEADLIADSRFRYLTDLFSEQIFLCALEGHAEFLQRSWLAKALEMQDDSGCYHNNDDEYSIYTTTLNRRYPGKSYCSERTSGMMIGALSVAVRFILQFYYNVKNPSHIKDNKLLNVSRFH